MKVSELIDRLQEFDLNLDVYLQKDPEGNGYDILYSIGEGIWDDDTMYDPEWSADDSCMEEYEWEAMKKRQRCLVLAP